MQLSIKCPLALAADDLLLLWREVVLQSPHPSVLPLPSPRPHAGMPQQGRTTGPRAGSLACRQLPNLVSPMSLLL